MLLYIGKRATRPVKSYKEASAIYCAERDASGEGGSTFPEGAIWADGLQVARVSYNGKVWSSLTSAEWTLSDQPIFDPYAGQEPLTINQIRANAAPRDPMAVQRLLSLPLTTVDQTKTFMEALHGMGLLFHFEDDATDCLEGKVSFAEATEINARVQTIYMVWQDAGHDMAEDCPIGYALLLLNGDA